MSPPKPGGMPFPPIILPIIFCISPMSFPSSDLSMDCKAPTPPICLSIAGGIALAIWFRFWFRACVCPYPPFLGTFRPFILPIIFANRLYSSMSSTTSPGPFPAPRPMRSIRFGSCNIFKSVVSSSSSVMLSIRHIIRFTFAWLSFSWPFGITSLPNPGIMDITLDIGPIFWMLANCSYKMRIVKCPAASLSSSSGCESVGIASAILSMNPVQSPKPNNRETNGFASNVSNSSMCSPVPMKMMGERVAATAEMAPPPFAWPSSFVTITEPTSTVALNALAWSCAAWPMLLSMTKMVISGLTASATERISSNNESSCLCLPLVSTMIKSFFSSVNRRTPSNAILAGSVSTYDP
mmetsp:Transcript_7649/g.32491  ORF Transcript_7649/g.32491 Transcript_7649/m.32491 type:complete len:352 (-) Transcript_7649:724-1779(-)